MSARKIVVKRKLSPVKQQWSSANSVEHSQVWECQSPAEQKLYSSMEALEEAGLYKKPKLRPAQRRAYSSLEFEDYEEDETTTLNLRINNNNNPMIYHQLFPCCHLPALVEDNIFSCLPLSSIMSLRSVSRAWNSTLSNVTSTLDSHTLAFTLFPKNRFERHKLIVGDGDALRLAIWNEDNNSHVSQMNLSLLPPGTSCTCPKGYTLVCATGNVFVFRYTKWYLVGNPVTGRYTKIREPTRGEPTRGGDVVYNRVALVLSSSEPLVFKLVRLDFCAGNACLEIEIFDSTIGSWDPVKRLFTNRCKALRSGWMETVTITWDGGEGAWYVLDKKETDRKWYVHGHRVADSLSKRWRVKGFGFDGRGNYPRHVWGLVRCGGRLLVVCREMRGKEFFIQVWGFRRDRVGDVEMVMESEERLESGADRFSVHCYRRVFDELELRICTDGVDKVWVLLPVWPSVSDMLMRYEMKSRSWKRYELKGCDLGGGDVGGIEGMAFTGEAGSDQSVITPEAWTL